MPINESKFFRLLRERNFRDAHALLDMEQADPDAECQHTLAHFRLAALNREGLFAEALDHIDRNLSNFFCKTTAFDEKARILFYLGRLNDAKETIDDAPFDLEIDQFPGLVQDARLLQCYIHWKLGGDISDLLGILPADFKSVVPDNTGTHTFHLSVSDLHQKKISSAQRP